MTWNNIISHYEDLFYEKKIMHVKNMISLTKRLSSNVITSSLYAKVIKEELILTKTNNENIKQPIPHIKVTPFPNGKLAIAIYNTVENDMRSTCQYEYAELQILECIHFSGLGGPEIL